MRESDEQILITLRNEAYDLTYKIHHFTDRFVRVWLSMRLSKRGVEVKEKDFEFWSNKVLPNVKEYMIGNKGCIDGLLERQLKDVEASREGYFL